MKVVNEETLELEEVPDDNSKKNNLDELKAKIAEALNCDPEEFNKRYRDYIVAESEFKSIYEPFKEKLLELYKEESEMPYNIAIGGIKVTYVSPSTRTSIDSKKLKEEEPEIAKKYTKTTNVNATLRLGGIIVDPDLI